MIFRISNHLFNAPGRYMSLRVKSYIVYGALIAGAAAVTIFVFYQKDYLFEQFDEMQSAHKEESRLREVDISILHTLQTQVVTLETIDIEYGSSHARKHLKYLLDFFNKIIVRHIKEGVEVAALGSALKAAHNAPTRDNMTLLRNNLNDFRKRLEQRLESSREHRKSLEEEFRNRSDLVSMIALILGLLGFTVLGIINALFFTRLTNDVQSLKKKAREIAAGHRGEMIPVTRNDEVGELFKSINKMASELEEHDKTLEIERLKYFQQEKMAAIGVLAAGIAHEVGNPIAAISALIEELKQTCTNCTDDTSNYSNVQKLDMLLEQTERLKKITREISTFARPQSKKRELLDLNGLIRDACSLMRYDRRWKGVTLEQDLDSKLPAICGVPDQLTQVIMNLLVNASDALEGIEDRPPTIKISTTLDEEENSIYMVVQDNGHGMDKETLQHALDAFYTTKEVGKGTGLGLSLCHSIITEHDGGQIYIESTPDIGTAIRILLPLLNKNGIQECIQ